MLLLSQLNFKVFSGYSNDISSIEPNKLRRSYDDVHFVLIFLNKNLFSSTSF